MISRRALFLAGAAVAAAGTLAACGSSEPATVAKLPDFAGQGGTTSFDGNWIGQGNSDWRFTVQGGVFSATGAGRGLSNWTGQMTGYIRTDHTVDGLASSNSGGPAAKVTGTWPRLDIHWSSSVSTVRLTRA